MTIQPDVSAFRGSLFPWQNSKPKTLKRKLCQYVPLTGRERTFSENEFIVSKTDIKGHITYANEVFLRVAGMTEAETIGAPHSVIRHPDMPRAVFKLLWNTLEAGNEIFAYVINLAKSGDYYWVLAHVTPSFDETGKIIAYHSNRRVPKSGALEKVKPLYAELRRIETESDNAKTGLVDSEKFLMTTLNGLGLSYGEFVFSL